MSKKTTKLTVHKNTLERRHRKEMQADMVSSARAMGKRDVRAFAIVAIDADGTAMANWDTGSILPMWGFAPMVADILNEDIRSSDIEDTWRPSLSERVRPNE